MGVKKTLGGDRLGSGNRIKQEMHNFYRSNHNLSKSFKSSMATGVLYPCYVNVGLKGDTWDIDMDAFVRTIPTRGPLFGSFKLQIDFFQIPFRLYHGVLHNNTTEIGLNMDRVILPKLKLQTTVQPYEYATKFERQISTSALVKYCGISGVGSWVGTSTDTRIERKFNALPILAYYDIFKNYYANQQEDNAYLISGQEQFAVQVVIDKIYDYLSQIFNHNSEGTYWLPYRKSVNNKSAKITIVGSNLNPAFIKIKAGEGEFEEPENVTQVAWASLQNLIDSGYVEITNETSNKLQFRFIKNWQNLGVSNNLIGIAATTDEFYTESDITLTEFPLKHIDAMRKQLLRMWDLGEEFVIGDPDQGDYLPYSALTGMDNKGFSYNKRIMNGLCVKTYQSDLFNNWLDTEWVNKITTLSKVVTTSGSFTIDSLNFAKKIYDLYNRIAISGGTYDDWQQAVYGDKVWGKAEKPIYCGGMSSEVVFEEVVSTAASGEDPLGSLGGRGKLNGRKGGKIVIKCNEASIIMGIVSLTPRIDYTEGNKWFVTDLDNMDDLHKPNLDQIGFQDLIVEQMAWWDARIYATDNMRIERSSAGKQPAWLNYMTDVNEAYGDFAEDEGKSFMVLSRNYEQDEFGKVKDITTYIDPSKFNYAFAYQELAAQNFWTFINFDIKCRRKMSATQIPNL